MISIAINKKALLVCTELILFANIFLVQFVYADEHVQDDNRYDGSEFNASSFVDTSFVKTDFKELGSTNPTSFQIKSNSEFSSKEDLRLSHKHSEKAGVSPADSGEDKGPIKNNSGCITSEERSNPVYDLPGDWVPDKLDLTSNGGFGISPDNGSPVPYRLNGHVDIQRGRP